MLKLHEATVWGMKAHGGQLSEITNLEYSIHLTEVAQILASLGASRHLQIAGRLHVSAEKNPANVEVFRALFGNHVASILSIYRECGGEDGWRGRKQRIIDRLELAERDTQILLVADAVADLRALTFEHTRKGSRLWKQLQVERKDLAWYYSEAQDILCDLQDDGEAKDLYWEFVDLYKNLFVTYYLDDEEGILYQIAHGLYGYAMTREELMWNQIEDQVPEGAEVISRSEAEALEEFWTSQKEEAYHDETLEGNELLEEAISAFRKNKDKDSLDYLAEVIAQRIESRGHLIMPIEDGIEEGHVAPRTITTDDGEVVIAAFTNQAEMKKGPYSEVLSIRIEHLFAVAKELDFVGGIVINPWGEFMYVGKDLISIIEERVELPQEDEEDGELTFEFVEIPTDKKLLN